MVAQIASHEQQRQLTLLAIHELPEFAQIYREARSDELRKIFETMHTAIFGTWFYRILTRKPAVEFKLVMTPNQHWVSSSKLIGEGYKLSLPYLCDDWTREISVSLHVAPNRQIMYGFSSKTYSGYEYTEIMKPYATFLGLINAMKREARLGGKHLINKHSHFVRIQLG